jgi:putative membrane protein insertion efficiency factor
MKSKRGALRLETHLSTEPPTPGKNPRLSHSHEYSGRAQRYAAPSPKEPSSLDSLKRSFDLSSIPQDFSAATQKRISAGLRRRAAPQRLTMHGFLPAQWTTPHTSGDYHASSARKSRPAQPFEAARAGSLSSEPHQSAQWLGYLSQSTPIGGESLFRDPSAGAAAIISPAATICSAAGRLVKSIFLRSIRVYQLCLSPVMPSACRFYPSCSEYSYEAVQKWGAWKGGRLALGRLLRCRPWGGRGYDPVP